MQVNLREQGMTLLSFLKTRCRSATSVKAIKRAINAKCCLVNGQIETFASYILRPGDQVVLDEDSFQLITLPQGTEMPILYEDEWLFIVDKPAGVVSQDATYRLVHRLDKETSGVLIFAKSEEVREKMIEVFRAHQVQKRYLAIVEGQMEQGTGVIRAALGKVGAYQGQTLYGVVTSPRGQSAQTRWRSLKTAMSASLLYLEPVTGRTHQLRVHLSHIRHPILGDTQYGRHFRSLKDYHPKRHLLHAHSISFQHPMLNIPIQIKAPLPIDFQSALKTLELC